jgi:hypothetical protein
VRPSSCIVMVMMLLFMVAGENRTREESKEPVWRAKMRSNHREARKKQIPHISPSVMWSRHKNVSADDEALESSSNLYKLFSGRRMACSDVESTRMKTNLRQFKRMWKSAFKRLESRISELEGQLHSFSEESRTQERNITNHIDLKASDDQKVQKRRL